MLSKSARLNVSENFKWVMGGSRIETPSLKLFYRMGSNPQAKSLKGSTGLAKVGVAVNSKEFKKANLRVDVKRLCFEAARMIYDNLPAGLNLVIMPKSSVTEKSVEELVLELQDAKIIN